MKKLRRQLQTPQDLMYLTSVDSLHTTYILTNHTDAHTSSRKGKYRRRWASFWLTWFLVKQMGRRVNGLTNLCEPRKLKTLFIVSISNHFLWLSSWFVHLIWLWVLMLCNSVPKSKKLILPPIKGGKESTFCLQGQFFALELRNSFHPWRLFRKPLEHSN